MTFRAVRVLQTVDLIAAEDTPYGKALQHFQIKVPQLSYHDHNCNSRIPELLEQLSRKGDRARHGCWYARNLRSRYELVKACVEAGTPVVLFQVPASNHSTECSLPTAVCI